MKTKILSGLGIVILGLIAILFFIRNRIILALPATGAIINPDSTMTRNDVRLALREKASAYGFNPDWFDAIAKHESNWKLDAVNNAGPDSKYGGSWGPMQMLKTNIERLGYTTNLVTTDPYIAGEAAGELMKEGSPQTFEDAVAWWNSGHKHLSDAPANSTVHEYWKDIQSDIAWVQANPPTEAEAMNA